MKTEIRVEGCLDVPRTLQRFHLFGEDPANRLSPGVFRRAVKVAGRWRGYEVRWRGSVDGVRLLVSTPRERSTRVRGGAAVGVGGHTVSGFPEAERLAGARVGELRRMQLTTRKSEYIVGLGRHVASGALDLTALGGRSNEDVIEALTAVRGFGRWTAAWFLPRHLGRGDVCAAGDLAVR